MVSYFTAHILGPGTHAARPAVMAVPVGAVYSCTDHGKVYRSDGTTWSDWFAPVTSTSPPGRDAEFYVSGVITVGTGQTRWYNDTGTTLTIVGVRATVVAAPTGASLIVDVNKNGTTIFTTQANRPTVAASGITSGKVVPDVTTVADGQYLTIDVDQVGSTVPGADLQVQITFG